MKNLKAGDEQKPKTIRLALILLALLTLVGGLAAGFRTSLDRLRSAMSVKKAADGQLLVMRYSGDYGFDDFLKKGVAGAANTASSPISRPAWACTCFAVLGSGNDSLLGRNYDYTEVRPLILYTNPPGGYASISMVDVTFLGVITEDLSWRNRLQLLKAPYYPFDGMNEVGLAVGMMAVPSANGGRDPQKVTLGSLQVIRLVLDHARNVPEAVALLKNYNVDFSGGPPIHYLMADAAGNSVVVEYLNGSPTVIHNSLPWQVATNFNLSMTSLAMAKSICWRYKTAYEALGQAVGRLTPVESLSLLHDVSQDITSWSIVYELTSGKVHLALDRDYEHVLDFTLDMRVAE